MFIDSLLKITGHSCIKHSIAFICHNVNIILTAHLNIEIASVVSLPRNDSFIRDCFVATLLAMTKEERQKPAPDTQLSLRAPCEIKDNASQ